MGDGGTSGSIPVNLDPNWPGLTAGPTSKVDPQAIADFADRFENALKEFDPGRPGSSAELRKIVPVDAELAAQYLPTARAAANAMSEAGNVIAYYLDEMLKQAQTAGALARTTAGKYSTTEDTNRTRFAVMADDPDYATGRDVTGSGSADSGAVA